MGEMLRVLPNVVIIAAIVLFIGEAARTGARVRRIREEDPSLAYVPVDKFPPELLNDHR